MFVKCLESVWEVFEKCLKSVWEVWEKCSRSVRQVFEKCLRSVREAFCFLWESLEAVCPGPEPTYVVYKYFKNAVCRRIKNKQYLKNGAHVSKTYLK